MKKTILILIAAVITILSFGQATPGPHANNVDLGLFNAGANGSSTSNAYLEFSLRIKTGGQTFTSTPVASDWVLYLKAPKTDFDETDVVNIAQVNSAIYGTSGTMAPQAPSVVDIGDPQYLYIPITLDAAQGMNLSPLAIGTWSFAFTLRVRNASAVDKTPAQHKMIKIVDEDPLNNGFLSGVFGTTTFTRLSMSGQNQLTPFALIILPVNLINFSGYKSGTKNVLRWTTESEHNNLGFEVQRSNNGVNFSAVGFVNSLAAGGNSPGELTYSFDDNSPLAAKTSYYRLKQVDLDNNSKLSNTVLIKGEKPRITGIGGIYPNPANELVNVVIDASQREDVTLVVMDVMGKTVKLKIVNVETGSNTVPVEINHLAQGSYLVKVVSRSTGDESAVSKFIKQ